MPFAHNLHQVTHIFAPRIIVTPSTPKFMNFEGRSIFEYPLY